MLLLFLPFDVGKPFVFLRSAPPLEKAPEGGLFDPVPVAAAADAIAADDCVEDGEEVEVVEEEETRRVCRVFVTSCACEK